MEPQHGGGATSGPYARSLSPSLTSLSAEPLPRANHPNHHGDASRQAHAASDPLAYGHGQPMHAPPPRMPFLSSPGPSTAEPVPARASGLFASVAKAAGFESSGLQPSTPTAYNSTGGAPAYGRAPSTSSPRFSRMGPGAQQQQQEAPLSPGQLRARMMREESRVRAQLDSSPPGGDVGRSRSTTEVTSYLTMAAEQLRAEEERGRGFQ